MADSSFYINKGPITLAELAKVCAASLKDSSKANVEIKNAATMDKAGEGDVCFFYDKKKKEAAAAIKATACVTTEELLPLIPDNVIKLTVENPKFAFVILINRLYAEPDIARTIAQSAKIAPTASIGENCFIGENAVIEDNVKIGSGCIIEHNAVISKSCQIGNNCRIGSGTVVSHCIMGNDCFVYRNVSIGQDGFGFVMMEGRHKKILQLGRVIIGNDVEIGAGTCVDRGALDDTIIGDGCRIDNLVQVAHNIVLGRGCVLVGQTGIAGSCTFGDYVVTGGQTGFADHLNIGSGAQIAAQSGIMRDIEPGAVVMGTPAVPIKDFMRQVSFLQKSANPKK